jgi:hypothetical protein
MRLAASAFIVEQRMHVCGLQPEMTQTESHHISLLVGLDLGTSMARYDGVSIMSDCDFVWQSCFLDHYKIDVRTQGLTGTGGPAARGVAGITCF